MNNKQMTFLENVDYFSQRDNQFNPSSACLPTSCAMAIEYITDIELKGKQLEDDIVEKIKNLTIEERNSVAKIHGDWLLSLNHPWTALPFNEYVINRDYIPCRLSWGISLKDVKKSIDSNKPIVCLGGFFIHC
jgi:hypothetical protein